MSAPAAAKALRRTSPRIGRYRLVTPIAAGGMAGVHLARVGGQSGFSRLVAIKLLHAHLIEDGDFAGMFVDEARFAARIRHPNVVDVYDVETIDGELLISMQFVEGAPLSALARAANKQRELLPLGVSLRVMHDVLVGLHAAHELADESGEAVGLIHRDVSPHNVLVGVDGMARVTDFGVAKARGRLVSTQGAAVKGKLRYLAPEQIQGAPLDRRVDVFAAGIVLWELLTGRALFGGEAEADTMMSVLTRPIPLPSKFAPNLPLEIERVCMRALERDRDKRYSTADQFAEALDDAAGKLIAKRRDVTMVVEDLHAAELARLRSALGRPPDHVDDAYGGAAGTGMARAGVSTSGVVPGGSVEPEASDTRSARPITASSAVTRGPRRVTWAAAAVGALALALGGGYYLGRPNVSAVAAASGNELVPEQAPVASTRAPVAPPAVELVPAPSASTSEPAKRPSVAVPRRRAPSTKPATKPPTSAKSSTKPTPPFMPGAL